MVRLQLKPKFSVRTGDVTVGTANNQFLQPIVDRREADTTLLIEDGQTVVLGGLRKKETTQDIRKVPMLGDIPALGGLFRSESEKTVTSELVVFITPRIIENPILTEVDKRQLEVTDFNGPSPVLTRAEKPIAKAKPKAKK
jgi:type II secretory pathway component GspD/PulD (secretin)